MLLLKIGKRRRGVITSDLRLVPGLWSQKEEPLGLVIFEKAPQDTVELISCAFGISRTEARKYVDTMKAFDIDDEVILLGVLNETLPHWLIENGNQEVSAELPSD